MQKEENYVLWNGYKVYKNGDIIGKKGKKIAVRVKDGMKVVSLKNEKGESTMLSVGRLIYRLFHHTPEQIDSDRRCKVIYIDGDKMNVNAENLYMSIPYNSWNKCHDKPIKKQKIKGNDPQAKKVSRFGISYKNMLKG